MRLLKLQIFRNKATNCQGASRVSITALAQRVRSNLQGNVGKITKNKGNAICSTTEKRIAIIKNYLILLLVHQTFRCDDNSLSLSFQNPKKISRIVQVQL